MGKTVLDRLCPISKSKEYKVLGHATDKLVSGISFPILKNIQSGLIITGNCPPAEKLGSFYLSDAYVSHNNKDKSFINKLYRVVRSFTIPAKCRTIARYHKKDGNTQTLLDIGCGTGSFASAMKKRGYNVLAVEQSEKAADETRRHGITVWNDLADARIEEHSVDIITLWHVLEHIDNLNETFYTIRKVLAPNGTLFIALPNCSGFDARHYEFNWAAYDVPRHLWHFTPDTLQLLAEREGFQVKARRRMPFDAYYISLLTEKQLGKSNLTAAAKAFWIGTRTLLRSLRRKEASSSILYILKRKS